METNPNDCRIPVAKPVTKSDTQFDPVTIEVIKRKKSEKSNKNDIEAILALDLLNGLSKNGQLPWFHDSSTRIVEDMRFFREKTLNNIVVMGTNTLLSFPDSKPLKDRTNIVVTRDKMKYLEQYKHDYDNLFFYSEEELITLLEHTRISSAKIFIIGGKQVYEKFLPYCSTIWLTRIKHDYSCDLTLNYNFSKYKKTLHYTDSNMDIEKLEF